VVKERTVEHYFGPMAITRDKKTQGFVFSNRKKQTTKYIKHK